MNHRQTAKSAGLKSSKHTELADMNNLRNAFGPLGEIEHLEPAGMTVTPPARMMPCDACQITTRHEKSASGSWICWCGYDQTAALIADERATTLLNATSRMIGGMRPQDRVRWIGLLVELLCCIPGAKQIIIDSAGRHGF
jgi:hypothetical protein